ncbi:MAG: TonB-dependent receptor [Saprospiraceae bacterium]|nr:TonB-dependent receptor [Saprospiraceae bacterium]
MLKNSVSLFLTGVIFAALAAPVNGQQLADTLRADTLPLVEISAARTTVKSDESALAVSVIDDGRIRIAQPQLTLAESLPAIPGIFVLGDANFAQDLRVSIRGFGARAGFGIRGIKVMLDGIPESTPDGQAQVDNLDPSMLQRIEVLRGGSAGLYGNASGGVLNLTTEGADDKTGVEFRMAAGSFGFRQWHAKAGFRHKNTSFKVGLTHVTTNGFRRHSGMKSTLATFKMRWSPAADSSIHLTFLANYTNSPQADDPGSLNANQDSINWRAALGANVQYHAGESLQQGRLAAILDKKFSRQVRLNARVWSALRQFDNFLPFRVGGQVGLERLTAGGMLQFELDSKARNRERQARYRFAAGLEIDWLQDKRSRFDNNEGLRGALGLRQHEVFSSSGVYLIGHWHPKGQLTLSGGVRGDLVRLRVRDRFLDDGDQSGDRNFQRISPWIGAAWRIRPRLNVYGNVTTNFETPALIELSNNPDGGGFADLNAQRTLSGEVGIRSRGRKQLNWEIAVFQARTRGELSPYELQDQPGRTFYRNAGYSVRRGVEAALGFSPFQGMEVWMNYTWSDFSFGKFISGGTDFAGKALPGLPRHNGQISARYHHRGGTFAQLSGRYTGRFFAENANAVAIQATTLVNARIGWRGMLDKVFCEVFFGSDNLGNARVYNNIRINAGGGRYFEPGAGRSFFAGVQFRL